MVPPSSRIGRRGISLVAQPPPSAQLRARSRIPPQLVKVDVHKAANQVSVKMPRQNA